MVMKYPGRGIGPRTTGTLDQSKPSPAAPPAHGAGAGATPGGTAGTAFWISIGSPDTTAGAVATGPAAPAIRGTASVWPFASVADTSLTCAWAAPSAYIPRAAITPATAHRRANLRRVILELHE